MLVHSPHLRSRRALSRSLREGSDTRGKTPGRRPLRLEPLEDRRLLSIPSGKVLFLDNVNAYCGSGRFGLARSGGARHGQYLGLLDRGVVLRSRHGTGRNGTPRFQGRRLRVGHRVLQRGGRLRFLLRYGRGNSNPCRDCNGDRHSGILRRAGHSVMARLHPQTTAGDYLLVVVDEEVLAVSSSLTFTAGVADSSSPVVVGAFSEPIGPIIGRAITQIDEVRLSRVDRYGPSYPVSPFETDSYHPSALAFLMPASTIHRPTRPFPTIRGTTTCW